jgi:hypothetical protein
VLKPISDALVWLMNSERRVDPLFRDQFDALFQRPLTGLVQLLINARRRNEQLAIAEERLLANEDAITRAIIEQMARFTREHYPHGGALRAGNTKTHGVVRGSFEVRRDLPPALRVGLFREPRAYPAWVRFAGPGPLAPPDVEDAGILSIGIKVMGVDGPKLLDDERATQDFTGISAPTFTTPNVIENVKLQRWIGAGTPVFYFINPLDSHLLDALMQGLYARTQANPLELQYWSCTPYLFGPGRAIQYTVRPRARKRDRPPRRFTDNYLREAMARTLAEREVAFDFLVQFQTDAHRMPVENASVRWPERLSPFRPLARLRIPRQQFDSPEQLRFGENLAFNPWHAMPEHRPLGNQNRARRAIYQELSRLRQELNGLPHAEPTGEEVFHRSAAPVQ